MVGGWALLMEESSSSQIHPTAAKLFRESRALHRLHRSTTAQADLEEFNCSGFKHLTEEKKATRDRKFRRVRGTEGGPITKQLHIQHTPRPVAQ